MSKSERKIPIKRINKWFSEEDFNLEIDMGREGIEGDGNFTVILYRVDRHTTQSDDIYNEASADEINFFPPVELYVVPIIEEPENLTYNDSSLRYLEDGNFTFEIYNKQLEELDVDVSLGDYIGYPVDETEIIYFSVTNSGEKFYNNTHTIIGYKGAFRTIQCTIANEDEFNGV
jgi:hypothetical protein